MSYFFSQESTSSSFSFDEASPPQKVIRRLPAKKHVVQERKPQKERKGKRKVKEDHHSMKRTKGSNIKSKGFSVIVDEDDDDDEDIDCVGPSELIDPIAAEIGSNDNMLNEEMDAMKQVFLRISEKKFKNNEEKKKECKKMYSDTFRKDVEKHFKAYQHDSKIQWERLNETFESNSSEAISTIQKSREKCQEFEKQYNTYMNTAKSHLLGLKKLLKNVDQMHQKCKADVEENYEDLGKKLEDQILQQYRKKLKEIKEDTSYLDPFQSQLKRLTPVVQDYNIPNSIQLP